MCRLVLMNKAGEKEIEKNYGLENYFNYLEKSLGGNGNGYALLRKGKIIEFNKGLNLSIKEIIRTIRKKSYDWCIFHTRLATVGILSDENCHPFIRNNNEVIAMNGTENKMDFIAGPLEITDTEAILETKVKYNLSLPALKYFKSIFIGFSKGKPYVVANNTYNLKLMRDVKKEAIVFASAFPDNIKKKIYKPVKPFIWNGDKIDMSNFKEYKENKYYHKYLFESYYNPFFTKDIEKEKDLYSNQEIDEFDYYSDLYKQYDKEMMENKRDGEKNAA